MELTVPLDVNQLQLGPQGCIGWAAGEGTGGRQGAGRLRWQALQALGPAGKETARGRDTGEKERWADVHSSAV